MTNQERKRRTAASLKARKPLDASWDAGREYGHMLGLGDGEARANAKHTRDLHAAERKANLAFVEALVKLMNAISQMSCTFYGEGGLRP